MWSSLILCTFLLIANNLALGNQQYGDCSFVNERELIWQYNVSRNPNMMPFQTVEVQYETTGTTISCINVIPKRQESGVARITSGGVGSDHVKLNIVATRGNFINVKVLVYGH